MKTAWFTFGQSHKHIINGFVYDRDIVIKITAQDPRAVMFSMFGPKWSWEYDHEPRMELYPRGVKEITA